MVVLRDASPQTAGREVSGCLSGRVGLWSPFKPGYTADLLLLVSPILPAIGGLYLRNTGAQPEP